MRAFAAAVALLVLVGCTPVPYRVIDPISNEVIGRCYDGTFEAWCQVAQPDGTVVVPGTSLAAAAMTLAGATMGTAATALPNR
jgi:hypothetical protein